MADSAAPDRRNLEAPKTPEVERQRTVLARFLAPALPADADGLAAALLLEFKSLASIWAQSEEALCRVIGTDNLQAARQILQSRALSEEIMRCELTDIRVDPLDPRLRGYLIASMGSLRDETLRVLFLDPARRLIADEQLQRGSLDQLMLYPRTLFRRALELNAAELLLVHNHPSGDPRPSDADIRVTQRIEQIGRALDVRLLDHIIVTAREAHHIMCDDVLAGNVAASGNWTLRSPPRGINRSPSDIDAAALYNARATVRRRQLRQQLIGSSELFGEPAWDMLIDLFIHRCENKPLPVSSLCIQSSIPMSSGLRLVHRLCEAGIARRTDDPGDRRRSFISLSPRTADILRAYFSEGIE